MTSNQDINWNSYDLLTIRVALQQKKITYQQLVVDSLRCIAQHQQLNMVLNIRSKAAFLLAHHLDQQKSELTKNILYGIPFAVKDNFNIQNEVTTAGCAFLKKYYPNDHATVIKLLQQQQANLIAKTNMDALGMGGSGLTSDYGIVHNPYDPQRIAGGSSSGSAVLVAVGAVVYALGSDTGDSIRKPASYCGIVGLKPTYGLISRAGVIGFSPSLDTIGILTRSVADCAEVLTVLAQHDPHDFTSIFLNQQINYGLLARQKNQARKLKVLYFENMFVTLRSEIRTLYQKLWYFFKEQHVRLDKQIFPAQLLNILPVVYKIISCSEATTTHANLDGVNFERRVNAINFKKSSQQARARFLNYELKKRFVFGSYCLLPENQKNILHQAQKIRRWLHHFFTNLWKKYDIIIFPAATDITPLISDVQQRLKQVDTTPDHIYCVEEVLTLANLVGFPSLTLPLGFVEGLPIGININAATLREVQLLQMGTLIEAYTGLKNWKFHNNHSQ